MWAEGKASPPLPSGGCTGSCACFPALACQETVTATNTDCPPEQDTASPSSATHTHTYGGWGEPSRRTSPGSPGEGEGTDLHGFEGGDEGEHDVVARTAGAGQQRSTPEEREENSLRKVANSKGCLEGQLKLPGVTENCISALNSPAIPQQRAECTQSLPAATLHEALNSWSRQLLLNPPSTATELQEHGFLL